jgi:ABC-type glycerol-3-phosphate transport system substrate-binding protein
VKRFLSRSLLTVLITGGILMLIFGPRPPAEPAKQCVHIQYWEKWTGLEGQQMKEIVDEFNQTVGKDKNIWVDFVSMSQIDRKTLISTAAGVPPDVAGLWDTQVLQFASMGALEPLDAYAARYGLTRDKYKHVYWDGAMYNGKLYAIPSTVWCVALLWNKEIFEEKASQIRAAGLDPDRAPRTIAELDKYAAAIDTWKTIGSDKHLSLTGFIPLEPGTATNLMPYWFGSPIADPSGTKLLLTSPEVHATYDWIRGYSERLGAIKLAEFRSGFSSGATGLFDTPQNPFLVGWNSMEAQGPWMSAFIEKLKPSMNRWHVPPKQLEREMNFNQIHAGMPRQQIEDILGPPDGSLGAASLWHAGVKDITITFADDKVVDAQANLIPAKDRQKYCQWGAAAFPSNIPGQENITWAGMDVWVVPSTSKHKDEAFEFIAFASRQKEIEKLASEHCNLSPLIEESDDYRQNHPNPYVDVYEMLAASPNARALPRVVNWPEIFDELTQAAERSYMLQGTTQQILAETQSRAQHELNKTLDLPEWSQSQSQSQSQ